MDYLDKLIEERANRILWLCEILSFHILENPDERKPDIAAFLAEHDAEDMVRHTDCIIRIAAEFAEARKSVIDARKRFAAECIRAHDLQIQINKLNEALKNQTNV